MISSLVNLFVFGNFFSKEFGMNDAFLYGAIVACGLFLVLAVVTFFTYGGLKDSLTNAKIGSIYNFEYVQPVTGIPERFMAKVLQVQRLSDATIENLNSSSRYRREDAQFQRSRHLVTAQTPDGKIRNFYAERTRNVRRPLLGGVLCNIL
jgi:hypothetical protein